jgi:hypothetical protein
MRLRKHFRARFTSAQRYMPIIMKLTGKHILNVQPSMVWKKLMDSQSLAKVVPGIPGSERISENFLNQLSHNDY